MGLSTDFERKAVDASLYLEIHAQREHFFSPLDGIYTHSHFAVFLDLIDKYGKSAVLNLFRSDGDGLFRVELLCDTCSSTRVEPFNKTGLINYFGHLLGSRRNYFNPRICSSCNATEEQNRERTQAAEREDDAKTFKENTKFYIDTFLSPSREWNKGTKTWEKWNSITRCLVDWDVICWTIRKMKYKDFVQTPYWKAIAEKRRKQADFKCVTCSTGGCLHVHHRSYENHGREHDNLNDLTVLCSKCHSTFHKEESND